MLWASALTLATKMSRPPSASAALLTQARSAFVSATSILAAPALDALIRERRHGLVDCGLMARAQRDIAALGRQQLGDGAADPARAAGDDRILAFEIEIHTPLLLPDLPVL